VWKFAKLIRSIGAMKTGGAQSPWEGSRELERGQEEAGEAKKGQRSQEGPGAARRSHLGGARKSAATQTGSYVN
jgi:hypothetical protein